MIHPRIVDYAQIVSEFLRARLRDLCSMHYTYSLYRSAIQIYCDSNS